MLRSTASKVMWVGRATVFLLGVAVILALLFGVASTALAHGGEKGFFHLGHKNVSKKVSTLIKKGTGPALNLQVGSGPPLAVSSSDRVDNLNADQLDDKDSDEILPLLRAQRDDQPSLTSSYLTGNSAEMNTVSITVPTDGFLVISSFAEFYNDSTTNTQKFSAITKLDGTTVHRAEVEIGPKAYGKVSPHTIVPASAGDHTITLVAERWSGSGGWFFNRNNLSVMFVPASRGDVTGVHQGS